MPFKRGLLYFEQRTLEPPMRRRFLLKSSFIADDEAQYLDVSTKKEKQRLESHVRVQRGAINPTETPG